MSIASQIYGVLNVPLMDYTVKYVKNKLDEKRFGQMVHKSIDATDSDSNAG